MRGRLIVVVMIQQGSGGRPVADSNSRRRHVAKLGHVRCDGTGFESAGGARELLGQLLRSILFIYTAQASRICSQASLTLAIQERASPYFERHETPQIIASPRFHLTIVLGPTSFSRSPNKQTDSRSSSYPTRSQSLILSVAEYGRH